PIADLRLTASHKHRIGPMARPAVLGFLNPVRGVLFIETATPRISLLFFGPAHSRTGVGPLIADCPNERGRKTKGLGEEVVFSINRPPPMGVTAMKSERKL